MLSQDLLGLQVDVVFAHPLSGGPNTKHLNYSFIKVRMLYTSWVYLLKTCITEQQGNWHFRRTLFVTSVKVMTLWLEWLCDTHNFCTSWTHAQRVY